MGSSLRPKSTRVKSARPGKRPAIHETSRKAENWSPAEIAQLFLDREFASRAADSGIAPANLIDARYPRLNLYESRFLSS
jgi:hypothetical protein